MNYCCFTLAEPGDWTNTDVFLYLIDDGVTSETFQQVGLDYLKTSEGRDLLKKYENRGYHEVFRWTDFFCEIPDSFLLPYGIHPQPLTFELLVNRFESVEEILPFTV